MTKFDDFHKERALNHQGLDYIGRELYAISPFPILGGLNGQFKVKFYSDKGQTKVMNITNEQFKAIERLLNGLTD